MTQIQIFENGDPAALTEQVNQWLKENPNITLAQPIEFRSAGTSYQTLMQVMIVYRQN